MQSFPRTILMGDAGAQSSELFPAAAGALGSPRHSPAAALGISLRPKVPAPGPRLCKGPCAGSGSLLFTSGASAMSQQCQCKWHPEHQHLPHRGHRL